MEEEEEEEDGRSWKEGEDKDARQAKSQEWASSSNTHDFSHGRLCRLCATIASKESEHGERVGIGMQRAGCVCVCGRQRGIPLASAVWQKKKKKKRKQRRPGCWAESNMIGGERMDERKWWRLQHSRVGSKSYE